jgi:hypothetical protein
MFMLLATPLMALALGYQNNLFKGAPDWLNLPLAMAAASLLGMQALYFFAGILTLPLAAGRAPDNNKYPSHKA